MTVADVILGLVFAAFVGLYVWMMHLEDTMPTWRATNTEHPDDSPGATIEWADRLHQLNEVDRTAGYVYPEEQQS